MNFWQKTQAFPPVLVRILARKPHGPPMSNVEIANRSGLSPAQVHDVSFTLSWDHVDFRTMRQFMAGCGIDLERREHLNRAQTYLRKQDALTEAKKRGWAYLRRSPDWTSFYEPLLRAYANRALTV